MAVLVRHVFDRPDPRDGPRVLVDRFWPGELPRTFALATIDEWYRDAAPSAELSRWYGSDRARFAAFRQQYLAELDDRAHADTLALLYGLVRGGLTLLTATRPLSLSPARVLAERLCTRPPDRIRPPVFEPAVPAHRATTRRADPVS